MDSGTLKARKTYLEIRSASDLSEVISSMKVDLRSYIGRKTSFVIDNDGRLIV